MRRRPRIPRVLKWFGAAACILTSVAFLMSGWVGLSYIDPGRGIWLILNAGSFSVIYDFQGQFPEPDAVRGFHANTHPFFAAAGWPKTHQKRVLPRGVKPGPGNFSFVEIPRWLPFLALFVPTLLLWFLDSRRRPRSGRRRRCDYDLTGNLSGLCPECGAERAAGQTL
jgi:hypothetical protein